MVDWWSDTERAIVECLGEAGPMTPEELARRVNMTQGDATAFLCMLAREKKIAIRLVGARDNSREHVQAPDEARVPAMP